MDAAEAPATGAAQEHAMTITARYPSRCAACHQPIAVGASIEWSKGQPARHTTCSGASVSAHTHRRSSARCADCGRPGASIECVDSSGITGMCCRSCASMSRYERSFA